LELSAKRRRTVPFAVVGKACESVKLGLHSKIVWPGPSGSQLR
jgi:hypothetical protein